MHYYQSKRMCCTRIPWCLLLFLGITAQDIGFPAEEPVMSLQNKDNRKPVYVPGKCPENELYYPGDQPTDWVCDCAPTYVYYPPKDMCYQVYRRGPCLPSEYIMLKRSEIIPQCVRNPCVTDEMVMYKGKCNRLYKKDACPQTLLGDSVLDINATSLELECTSETGTRLNIINVKNTSCSKGSKRSAAGQCRVEF